MKRSFSEQVFYGHVAIRLSWGLFVSFSGALSIQSQERSSSLPAGITLGKRAVGPVNGTLPPNAGGTGIVAAPGTDASALLTTLVMKANGGDEAAADSLVGRFLSGGDAKVEDTFRKEVEGASPVEAARILGLTILRAGSPSLHPEGLAFLKQAVEGESVLAMENMAMILLQGDFGQTVSTKEAVSLLKKARQLPGAREAHRLLGDLALKGTGMPQDMVMAIEYYRQGAEVGSIPCQLALHRLFRVDDPGPKDLVEAERFGRAAAEQGSAEAAFELAHFFEKYVENAPDWKRAAEWLRVAMERRHSGAATRLAGYHFTDKLGAVDAEEGVKILRAAAGLGDGEACYQIGELYEKGEHLPQDPVASTAWVRIAADFGYAQAENSYGLRLINGYGVSSDPTQAAQWFARAAKRGLPEAMLNLGVLHEEGVGIAVNQAEAMRLYEAAAAAGLSVANERLARLREKQTPGAGGAK